MAKTAQNKMKVKGIQHKTGEKIKVYIATWTYAVPLKDWSKEALLANIELGLKYAVKQKIKAQVLEDERTMKRSAGILEGMLKLANGDPEQLKIVAEICKAQNIRTEIQLEYVIHEDGFMTAPEPPAEDGEDDLDDLEDLEDGEDSEDSEDSEDVEESDEVVA